MKRVPEKQLQKSIALERIHTLFKQAQSATITLANRYVYLARKIQSRMKVRMPAELRYKFCKKCGTYWKHGTVRIRTQKSRVIFTCMACNVIRRKPFSK